MKKITVGTEISVFENIDELNTSDKALMNAATEALEKSYSPYSGFKVAASVLLDNGEILSGANQENAAFSLCLCAEMVVLSTVSSKYPNAKIKKMAVTIKSKRQVLDMPISPCGACRQTILEFELRQEENMKILLKGEVGAVYEMESAQSLLPLSFDGSKL